MYMDSHSVAQKRGHAAVMRATELSMDMLQGPDAVVQSCPQSILNFSCQVTSTAAPSSSGFSGHVAFAGLSSPSSQPASNAVRLRAGMLSSKAAFQSWLPTHLIRILTTWLTVRTREPVSFTCSAMGSLAVRTPYINDRNIRHQT